MNKTIGNLILMTLICVAVFIVFMAIRPAKAQWTPWGWEHSMATYGPLRVPLGFRAPPLPDPYACRLTVGPTVTRRPRPMRRRRPWSKSPSYNRGFGFGTR